MNAEEDEIRQDFQPVQDDYSKAHARVLPQKVLDEVHKRNRGKYHYPENGKALPELERMFWKSARWRIAFSSAFTAKTGRTGKSRQRWNCWASPIQALTM